jgi:hypothetical protein
VEGFNILLWCYRFNKYATPSGFRKTFDNTYTYFLNETFIALLVLQIYNHIFTNATIYLSQKQKKLYFFNKINTFGHINFSVQLPLSEPGQKHFEWIHGTFHSANWP